MIQWLYCLILFVVPNSVVFASLPEKHVDALPVITFININTEVVLQYDRNSYVLSQVHRRVPVQLSNRLIAKTALNISADELKKIGRRLSNVQQLARLKNSALWLLTLSDIHDLQNMMDRLQRDERVLYAQPDLLQTRELAQKLPVNQNVDHSLPKQVAGQNKRVRLAIIDDGFNFNHPEFASIKLVFEYDADLRVQSASPKNGLDQHGTLVAGVIVAAADKKGIDGLVPDVELIAIRQVSSWTSDMVLAFSVARMMKADIVNSSWILPFLPEPLFDFLSDWLQQEQPYLMFAAGNNQQDACTVNALSELTGVLLIGAAGENGQPLPYSNYGACVSFYAPAKFMSTSASGIGYKRFGGTSAATAYASGIVARELMQGRKPNNLAVQRLFKRREINK